MQITFVLPAVPRVPMGGVKVVYAHAAGLAALGHEVTVIAPRRASDGLRHRVFERMVRLRDRWHGVGDCHYAAELVVTREVRSVGPTTVPDGHAVIATGWQTAPWVHALGPEKGAKIYFLQHVETFMNRSAADTWRLPFTRIAISSWIQRRLAADGVEVHGLVPNAVDPAEFGLDAPIECRPPSLAWLYHRQPVKGPTEGIAVLEALRARRPDLRAEVFSARPPSHRLPRWIHHHVRPRLETLRALYNRNAIILHTALMEGWGLTPMEGAACGCAVAAFDNGGVREYLTDDSAALVPVGDVNALVDAVDRLLGDPEERVRLATAAHAAVMAFSWKDSTARFERLIHTAVSTSSRDA